MLQAHLQGSAKAHPRGTVSAWALRSAAVGTLPILAVGLCAIARAWGSTSCSSSWSLVPGTSHGAILQRCSPGQQVQLADQGDPLSPTNARNPASSSDTCVATSSHLALSPCIVPRLGWLRVAGRGLGSRVGGLGTSAVARLRRTIPCAPSIPPCCSPGSRSLCALSCRVLPPSTGGCSVGRSSAAGTIAAGGCVPCAVVLAPVGRCGSSSWRSSSNLLSTVLGPVAALASSWRCAGAAVALLRHRGHRRGATIASGVGPAGSWRTGSAIGAGLAAEPSIVAGGRSRLGSVALLLCAYNPEIMRFSGDRKQHKHAA